MQTANTLDRAVAVAAAGDWPAEQARDSLTLPFDLRYRRRLRLTSDGGAEILLDLAQARALADGDGLQLENGAWLVVRAAPEPLLEIRGRDAHHLARLAWHLGNRHLPCEICADRLLIAPDSVIAEMLRGLGASVVAVEAPFQPEGGAYGHGH